MKKVVLLIFIFFTTQTFGQKNLISGDLRGFANGDKVFFQDPDQQKILDSTIIFNNKFSLKIALDEIPKGYYLNIKSDSKFYYCFLFIANENVKIKGQKKDFPNDLLITGSKNHLVRSILNDKTKILDKERDKVVSFLRADVPNENDTIYKVAYKKNSNRLKEIDKTTDSIKKDFIIQNLNTYYGLNELYYLRSKFEKQTLQKMYSGLKAVYKKSIYGERISNFLKIGDALKKGNQYFDFEAKDTSGKKYKISEFSGKYILLDFTETYCGPCIESVEELKMVSKKYSDSLTVISFSADKSDLIWKTGLKRDNINWLSLSDGKGTYGNILLKYNVDSYPTFFLINKNGEIINIQKGFGVGIVENMLKAILNQKLQPSLTVLPPSMKRPLPAVRS